MSDQETSVAPEVALMEALIDKPEEAQEVEETAAETTEETTEETPETETPETTPAKYKVTVKGEQGADEERELTLEELAKGYMLNADYTRKTQEAASQRREVEAQYAKALQEQQSSAIQRLEQLQELVLAQAAPELHGVDWVSLSVQDPAKFVQLQAKQQQVHNTWAALEQQKTQARQQQEKALTDAVSGVFKASDEILSRAIPGLDADKTAQLLGDVQKSLGWSGDDLKTAAKAMAQAGMHPGTLGQVLVLAHKALQYDALQKAKPAAMAKVAAAPPKVIKPAAPVQRSAIQNKAATDRLQKHGRMEDLAALIPR